MIIFDIGTGSKFSTKNFTINDEDTVYCFEPIPELINKLKNTHKSNNFNFIQKAVSNSNDIVKFNVAGILDHNLSSILNFSDNAFNSWPGRDDFIVTQTIKVETIRLDLFIQQQESIKTIDYINTDTNGNDIRVLDSMANHINIVKQGSMVASRVPEAIYLGQNSLSESIEFLKSHHFSIVNVLPIDQYCNQVKIYFQKDEIHSS